MPDLNDIIETQHAAPLFLWWQWLLIAIASILTVIALALIIKHFISKESTRTANHLSNALNKLNELDLDTTDSNLLAVQLSLVVRHYLQQKFSDNALFETDEEFHARSLHLDRLSPETSQRLRTYLVTVADHKYAPKTSDKQALQSLVSSATDLLTDIDTSNYVSDPSTPPPPPPPLPRISK